MKQGGLFAPTDRLALPDRVRVLSLWSLWAAAVAAGVKTIETRRWQWPYEPGWLVIHAAQRSDGPIAGRVEPFPAVPHVTPGALCALVWVSGSRPLVPADAHRALVYQEGLWAWDLQRIHRLKAIKMRGPQKFSSVDRDVIIEALGL